MYFCHSFTFHPFLETNFEKNKTTVCSEKDMYLKCYTSLTLFTNLINVYREKEKVLIEYECIFERGLINTIVKNFLLKILVNFGKIIFHLCMTMYVIFFQTAVATPEIHA